VGLEVTMEGVKTGTGMERWRERVPVFRGCDAEAASANISQAKGGHDVQFLVQINTQNCQQSRMSEVQEKKVLSGLAGLLAVVAAHFS